MKKNLLNLVLLSVVISGFAQQRPHYTQYILNNYILNPALSGIENYIDAKFSVRDQWVGLNGAPKTMYFSIHGPLGKKDYKPSATGFNLPGENPRGDSYWSNYEASEPHHGIGFSVIQDQTGLYSNLNANFSYAYHLGISSRTNIAAGFAAGLRKISYNRSKAKSVDPNDPALAAIGDIYKTTPDLSAGIWIYSADYFLGASVQEIIPQKVSFGTDQSGFSLLPHLFTTAGYRFLVNDNVNITPSIMMKQVLKSPLSPQFELNVKMQYQDLIWLGGGFRFEDGYAAMIGFKAGNNFNVGYSYDLTTTHLNTVSRGTHELILGIMLNNRYNDKCPANNW